MMILKAQKKITTGKTTMIAMEKILHDFRHSHMSFDPLMNQINVELTR